jgi:hypothetical protein
MENNTPYLDKWIVQSTKRQLQNPLNMPLDVALREAVRAAFALKRRWEPSKKTPGLRSLPDLSLSLADDLLSLVRAIQEAQFVCFVEDESIPPEEDDPPKERAKRLIADLRAPLEYIEDTLPPLQQAQLEKFRGLPEQKKDDEISVNILLRVYREVAFNSLAQLSELGESFDEAWIKEADEIIALLGEGKEDTSYAPQQARYRFYQLLALLQEKVGTLRAAAGFVFRSHKKILKEFTSAHGRIQRRKSKQAKKEAKK